MEVCSGLPEYKIWLIGDSNPGCFKKIHYPLDKKHPIRHNIWTSILDEIQDYIYRSCINDGIYPRRLDADKLYIRNAVEDRKDRALVTSLKWKKKGLNRKLDELSGLIMCYKPIIIITFGQFSYEFTRRAFKKDINRVEHWTKKELGNEFRKSINNFAIDNVNIVPLLHNVIARGDFTGAGEEFIMGKNVECCYFEYTGAILGALFYEHMDEFNIWI